MAEKKCRCPPPGAPAWMTTFADLMSLLMCFFVLLLAFSEMDVLKFEALSGSMKYAFGVQHQIELHDIPKGTSIIALEFRPGKPDDTPIDIINQKTVETTQSSLEFTPGNRSKVGGKQEEGGDTKEVVQEKNKIDEIPTNPEDDAVNDQDNERQKKLMTQLEEFVQDGSIEIDTEGQEVIIRIRERGAFAAGSGYVQPKFKPTLRKIATLLNDVPGEVTVTGHTDDVQISNERYRSNWDLSSRRAVAVAAEMTKVKSFDQGRLTLKAVADNDPILPNTTAENRATNRRVEISILQGKPLITPPISIDEQLPQP